MTRHIFSAYVAAPFVDGPYVASDVHPVLERMNVQPRSSWVAESNGAPESLERLSDRDARARIEANDRDLFGSQLVLALARFGAGGEMFVEVGRALDRHIPVVWVGPHRVLSARRRGVVHAASLEDALTLIENSVEYVRRPAPLLPDSVRTALWNLIVHLEHDDVRAMRLHIAS